MGLLSYIDELIPKPSEADIEKLRQHIKELRSGESANPYGLLGPTDEELAQLRAQRGLSPAEPPSPWVSIGRGVTDLWEPVKQTYLNATDPAQAQAYRQQRAEDERLYQRGMQWADPQPGYVPSRDDVWRMQAHQLPMLLGGIIGPSMALPQSLISYGGSQDLYDALNALRQQIGIGEWS
jgi:hypothetical protein